MHAIVHAYSWYLLSLSVSWKWNCLKLVSCTLLYLKGPNAKRRMLIWGLCCVCHTYFNFIFWGHSGLLIAHTYIHTRIYRCIHAYNRCIRSEKGYNWQRTQYYAQKSRTWLRVFCAGFSVLHLHNWGRRKMGRDEAPHKALYMFLILVFQCRYQFCQKLRWKCTYACMISRHFSNQETKPVGIAAVATFPTVRCGQRRICSCSTGGRPRPQYI